VSASKAEEVDLEQNGYKMLEANLNEGTFGRPVYIWYVWHYTYTCICILAYVRVRAIIEHMYRRLHASYAVACVDIALYDCRFKNSR
jgi:hypothetical protein